MVFIRVYDIDLLEFLNEEFYIFERFFIPARLIYYSLNFLSFNCTKLMYSLLDLKLFTHQKCLLNHIDSLWVVPDPWKSRIFFRGE